MRWKQIQEAPITNWEVDPEIEDRESEMMSKFHGYSQERKHWPDIDKKLIRDPVTIKKIQDSFLKVSTNFNLYFWQSTDPDYDKFMQVGVKNINWIEKEMGVRVADYFRKIGTTNAINIIMVGNISDEAYVPLKNAWMLSHRIAHVLVGGFHEDPPLGAGGMDSSHVVISLFDNFIHKIMTTYYGVEWAEDDYYLNQDYMEVYGKELGQMLGTMKSARNKNLVNYYEWMYETFVQYLLTGNIKFNPLIDIGPDEKIIKSGSDKALEKFRRKLISKFDALLKQSVGKMFVM